MKQTLLDELPFIECSVGGRHQASVFYTHFLTYFSHPSEIDIIIIPLLMLRHWSDLTRAKEQGNAKKI